METNGVNLITNRIQSYTHKVPIIKGAVNLHKPNRYIAKRLSISVLFLFVSIYAMSFMDAVAWYRMPEYENDKILQDIGFQIIPYNCPKSPTNIQTLIIKYNLIINLVVCIFNNDGMFRIQRFMHVTSCTFILRGITISVTSYPSPNPVCDDETKHFWGEKGYVYVAMSSLPTKACGDLMFSGHTAMLTLLLLFEYNYDIWPKINAIKIIQLAKTLIGYYSIISCRSHYTSDVIVGIIVTVLLFITSQTYFPTSKYISNIEMREQEKIKYDPCHFDMDTGDRMEMV